MKFVMKLFIWAAAIGGGCTIGCISIKMWAIIVIYLAARLAPVHIPKVEF